MEKTTKRALSLTALMAAAVVFGMVVASSVNVTQRSEAQREATAPRAHTAAANVPSFADIAQEAMPSVVSITSTDIVKGSQGRRYANPFGGDGDPFEFFFGPNNPHGRPQQDDEEHK